MRRLPIAAALCLLVLTASPAVLAREAHAGRYIVVLKDRVARPGAVASEHARRFGLDVRHVYRSAIRGYAATISRSALSDLRSDARVAFVSADRAITADVQTLPTGVNRIEGDQSSTTSGNGSGAVSIDVAVIDTGIDLDHPDLNVVGGKNCSGGRRSNFDDGNGHGSHVAGTIGARDDGLGVVGMAPGARLWAVRSLNNAGSGSTSSIVCGIDFVDSKSPARGGPIRVANMSLGGAGSDDGSCGTKNSDAMHAAICRAVGHGVTFVVSAGNSHANLSGSVPAAYNEVLTVTAVADFNGAAGGGAAATCRADVDDTAADFSNFTFAGSADQGHTIAAPGVCIRSTWKGGVYRTISGTSMASPHVAGTAALCIATGGCAGSQSQIRQKLRNDAAGRPQSYGFVGDPYRPIHTGNGSTLFYGHLVYAGGY